MVRGAPRRGKYRKRKRDELTSSEVSAIIETCDSSIIWARDEAIISLMAYCPLRTVEIHRAYIDNLQTRDWRSVLWIRGKGHEDSDEFVVLPEAADRALREWLSLRGGEAGPLFHSFSRQNSGDPLSTRGIRSIGKTKFREAGIFNNNKTTHSLRHSAISNAIRIGGTPLQVQAIARHSSFDTTLRLLPWDREARKSSGRFPKLFISSPPGNSQVVSIPHWCGCTASLSTLRCF